MPLEGHEAPQYQGGRDGDRQRLSLPNGMEQALSHTVSQVTSHKCATTSPCRTLSRALPAQKGSGHGLRHLQLRVAEWGAPERGVLTTGSPALGEVQLRELGRVVVQSICLPGGVHRSPVANRMTHICWPGEGSLVGGGMV